jgi:hypothetical protein
MTGANLSVAAGQRLAEAVLELLAAEHREIPQKGALRPIGAIRDDEIVDLRVRVAIFNAQRRR